jgi:hypothetical protein
MINQFYKLFYKCNLEQTLKVVQLTKTLYAWCHDTQHNDTCVLCFSVMLSVALLNVIMLNVVMLSVVAHIHSS